MLYDERFRCALELFDSIRPLAVGEALILKPPILNMLDEEALVYLLNSNNLTIKKFLPSVYVESEIEAKSKLIELINGIVLRNSLFYCIRPKSFQAPIGYININTPIAATGLNNWTVDYWLNDKYQGNNLMSASLAAVLRYLREYMVSEVMALVHVHNLKSINVLQRLGFKKINQEQGGEYRFLYSITLT